MSESAHIATITVQSLLVILNIAGNSLVCIIIMKNQEMRTSVNYLLMNLSAADMTVGIFLEPRHIFKHFFNHPDGVTGNVLCKLLTSGPLGWIGSCASVFSFVVIAFERYYAVIHPHGNEGRLSKRKIKVIIPCSWIFGVILNIPWILFNNYSEELGACSSTWPAKWMIKAYSMTWFLLMGFLPVSLMAALYIRVVYALWFKRGEHSQQQGVMKVRKRVTLSVLTVSVIFGVCYMTDSSSYVISTYYPSGAFLPDVASSTLILFNSAINPIVYALVNERFRQKLTKMVRCTFWPATNMVHPARDIHDQMMELSIGPTHSAQGTD